MEDRKRTVIVQLLDHWPEFFERAASGSAPIAGEQGLALVSSMSRYPSVIELGRLLVLLRAKMPQHYKHLIGFYGSEWRCVDTVVKVRNAHGKLVEKPSRERARVVPSWVRARTVEMGVDIICGLWDPRVVLELPPALTRKLRPLADGDGWTEAA